MNDEATLRIWANAISHLEHQITERIFETTLDLMTHTLNDENQFLRIRDDIKTVTTQGRPTKLRKIIQTVLSEMADDIAGEHFTPEAYDEDTSYFDEVEEAA